MSQRTWERMRNVVWRIVESGCMLASWERRWTRIVEMSGGMQSAGEMVVRVGRHSMRNVRDSSTAVFVWTEDTITGRKVWRSEMVMWMPECARRMRFPTDGISFMRSTDIFACCKTV